MNLLDRNRTRIFDLKFQNQEYLAMRTNLQRRQQFMLNLQIPDVISDSHSLPLLDDQSLELKVPIRSPCNLSPAIPSINMIPKHRSMILPSVPKFHGLQLRHILYRPSRLVKHMLNMSRIIIRLEITRRKCQRLQTFPDALSTHIPEEPCIRHKSDSEMLEPQTRLG